MPERIDDSVKREIVMMSSCEACEQHKSDLGTLIGIYNSIQDSFPTMEFVYQIELVKLMYEQFKLDKRTKIIQGFKQTNIKDMRR